MQHTLHQILIANGSLVRKYWSAYWEARQEELSAHGYPPVTRDFRVKAILATDSVEGKYLLIQLIFDLNRYPRETRIHSVFKVGREWGSMQFYIDAPEEALTLGRVFYLGTFVVQTS
jgi:hypothetical protein